MVLPPKDSYLNPDPKRRIRIRKKLVWIRDCRLRVWYRTYLWAPIFPVEPPYSSIAVPLQYISYRIMWIRISQQYNNGPESPHPFLKPCFCAGESRRSTIARAGAQTDVDIREDEQCATSLGCQLISCFRFVFLTINRSISWCHFNC